MRPLLLAAVALVAAVAPASTRADDPAVALATDAQAVTYGAAVLLEGSVGVAAETPDVEIYERRAPSRRFVDIGAARVTETLGGYAFEKRVDPTVTSTYRAVAEGAASPPVVIRVRPRVELRRAHGTIEVGAAAGANVANTAAILQRKTAHGWTRIATLRLGDREPHLLDRLPRGRSTLRAVLPARDHVLERGVSRPLTVRL